MRKYVVYVSLIVVSVLYFNQCCQSAYNNKISIQHISVVNDSLQFYKNKQGRFVAEKKAYEGTEKQLKKIIEDKSENNKQLKFALKKWKKLASVSEIKTETVIKEVFIPFDKRIDYAFSKVFKTENKYYSIFGSTNQLGVNIDSLLIPNIQIIASGSKKISFFKTEYRFEVTNSNPFIKVTQADTYNFIEKRKRFGVGVLVGFGIYYKGVFAGVGGSYDLVQF